ncbi:probable serine/threonine-protein kinase PBL7 [Asparagus officinalis]|uniref:probable serine/threonine-protein kinase PBL7 n=1 Tax=Asparagus officinalis TaxID=4686 RepID=UPI00098DF846|nr:probable serine/threonine-protein kinase PBL7 [Asparagus officinalis]
MGCYHSITGINPKSVERERARNELVEREEEGRYRKMVMGLSLILSIFRKKGWLKRRKRREEEVDGGVENKSLLLAKDGGERGESEDEPQSVHSSFRFSFGSQAEAEEVGVGPGVVAEGAAVVLLVNLEDEGVETGKGEGDEEGEVELRERQKWRRLESLEKSITPVAGLLVRFSYSQIRAATRNFSRGRELGRGALSRVYRGRIGVGRSTVAIKKVEGQDRESAKAFCRELMIASSLHHPNIAPLLGFCVDQQGLFLVYKYVSGGSLDRHLHPDDKRRKVLPWEVRYKVALGVAQAIGYLHFDTDKCVVHRDIKPSNILLSSDKSAKLCDFGLATWTHGPSLPFLCKAVKGTFGYLAPEYFQHGKLSDKTDVYAFGVLLLELITGRKAIDRSRPQGDENLVLWAKPYLRQGERAMEKFIDPNLKPGSYGWGEMTRMARAASACLRSEESTRPSIDQVIKMLQAEEEFSCSTDWSVFSGNHSCLFSGPLSSQFYGQAQEKSDIMRGHLALAMLGVSDSDSDESYSR